MAVRFRYFTTGDRATFTVGAEGLGEAAKAGLGGMRGWGAAGNGEGFRTVRLDGALMTGVGWAGSERDVFHGAAFHFKDAAGPPRRGAHRYTVNSSMLERADLIGRDGPVQLFADGAARCPLRCGQSLAGRGGTELRE